MTTRGDVFERRDRRLRAAGGMMMVAIGDHRHLPRAEQAVIEVTLVAIEGQAPATMIPGTTLILRTIRGNNNSPNGGGETIITTMAVAIGELPGIDLREGSNGRMTTTTTTATMSVTIGELPGIVPREGKAVVAAGEVEEVMILAAGGEVVAEEVISVEVVAEEVAEVVILAAVAAEEVAEVVVEIARVMIHRRRAPST